MNDKRNERKYFTHIPGLRQKPIGISKLPNFPVYPKNDPLHLLAHQDQ